MMPFLSIIIVNHNGKKYLKDALDSIKAQDYKNYEIIIADTESIDGSNDFVKTHYPEAVFLPVKNLGYGYACNKASDITNGHYLFFMNEDMELTPGFLQSLITYHMSLDEKTRGSTAPCLVYKGGPVDLTATHPGKLDLFGFPVDIKSPDSVVIPGVFLIEKHLFKKVGGFNENIFLFGEDVDFSWRLKIFGYRTNVFNGTYIIHVGGASGSNLSTKGLIRIVTSGFIPSFCNFGTFLLLVTMPFHAIYILISVLAIFLSKGFKLETFKFFNDFLILTYRKLPKLFEQRRFVQTHRKLSDFKIVKTFIIIPALIYNRTFARLTRHRMV